MVNLYTINSTDEFMHPNKTVFKFINKFDIKLSVIIWLIHFVVLYDEVLNRIILSVSRLPSLSM